MKQISRRTSAALSGRSQSNLGQLKSTQLTPPESLLPWLNTTGSLTAQLEAVLGQKLQIRPVQEGFKLMSPQMTQLIDSTGRTRQMAICREVELLGDQGVAWVSAQSWFVLSSLKGARRRLKNLGRTPLGYVLFDRTELECHRCVCLTDQGWSRRNTYRWRGAELLVIETFRPEFAKLVQQHGWTP